MKALTTHIYYYFYAVALLILDILCCTFFHKQLIYGVLCIFIIALLRAPSWPLWSFLTLLLALESFFYYGTCWVALVYIIPLTLIARYMRNSWYESGIQRYILLLLATLTICLYIEPFILGLSSSTTYILTKIFATLVVLASISWIIG